eukprot:COSAG01_NODE_1723_length_9381_cov_23.828611_5_plen_200_part_00
MGYGSLGSTGPGRPLLRYTASSLGNLDDRHGAFLRLLCAALGLAPRDLSRGAAGELSDSCPPEERGWTPTKAAGGACTPMLTDAASFQIVYPSTGALARAPPERVLRSSWMLSGNDHAEAAVRRARARGDALGWADAAPPTPEYAGTLSHSKVLSCHWVPTPGHGGGGAQAEVRRPWRPFRRPFGLSFSYATSVLVKKY